MYTESQFQTLAEESFVALFKKHRDHYIRVVGGVRSIQSDIAEGALVLPIEVAEVMEPMLVGLDAPFREYLKERKIYTDSTVKRVYARIFARYVVAQVWEDL